MAKPKETAKWEVVIPINESDDVLLRAKVPGGWIYRTEYRDSVALAFVPAPLRPGKLIKSVVVEGRR